MNFLKDWFEKHFQIYQNNAKSDIAELDDIFENVWTVEEKQLIEEACGMF